MKDKIPVISEDDDTNIVSFQVEGHTSDAWSELDHFTCLNLVETDHTGNTVTDADDCAELLDIVLSRTESTTWVMFMILSWITLAVSAIPSFLLENLWARRSIPLIYVE